MHPYKFTLTVPGTHLQGSFQVVLLIVLHEEELALVLVQHSYTVCLLAVITMAKRSTGEAYSGGSVVTNPAYKMNISNALYDYADQHARSSLPNYASEYVDNQSQSPGEHIYTDVHVQPSNEVTSKDMRKPKKLEKNQAYKVFSCIGILLSLFTAIIALVIALVALVGGSTSNPGEQEIRILTSKLNSLVNEVDSLLESWNTTILALQVEAQEARAQINESFMLEIQALEIQFNESIQKIQSQLMDKGSYLSAMAKCNNSSISTQSEYERFMTSFIYYIMIVLDSRYVHFVSRYTLHKMGE